jgi:hypothetical protein
MIPATDDSARASTKHPHVDRRIAVRQVPEKTHPVQVLEPPSGKPQPAIIRDISISGIGLLVKKPFDPGTHLQLDVRSPDKKLTYTMWANVVHVTAKGDDSCLIGCAFSRELSSSELQNLL